MRKFNNKTIAKKYFGYQRVIKAFAVSVAVVLCGLLYSCKEVNKAEIIWAEDDSTKTAEGEVTENTAGYATKEASAQTLYVYVCGCVQSPGVYEANEGARIYSLVEMAGGFTNDAAEWLVNMAEAVYDGQTLYIPSKEQAENGEVQIPVSGQSKASSKVNINSATKEQLMTLAGIGESRAEDIISYRNKNGGFKTIEDIMNVSGIKEAAYEKIKENICVR